MNKKQLIITFVLCAVVVILGIVSYYRQASSWETSLDAKDKEIVKNFDVNKVCRIKIKNASAFVNVQKKDSIWRVNEKSGYPADFQAVFEILNRIAEMKTVQILDVPKEQLSRFEMLEPGKGAESGTLVELYDKDNAKIFALLLGKQHKSKGQENPYFDSSYPVGRYLMALDGKNKVVLVSDPLEMLQPSIPMWLAKDFIKIESISSLALASSKKQNNWKISRKAASDKFVLEGIKKDDAPDENSMNAIADSLSKLSFVSPVPLSKIAETGLENPEGVLTVDTFDGFRYVLKIASAEGKHFMKLDMSLLPQESPAPAPEKKESAAAETVKDESTEKKENQEKTDRLDGKLKKDKIYTEWIYEIDEKTASGLLKSLGDFIVKKAEAAAPAKASSHGDKKSPKKAR